VFAPSSVTPARRIDAHLIGLSEGIRSLDDVCEQRRDLSVAKDGEEM
jgi:hypothetical protein